MLECSSPQIQKKKKRGGAEFLDAVAEMEVFVEREGLTSL